MNVCVCVCVTRADFEKHHNNLLCAGLASPGCNYSSLLNKNNTIGFRVHVGTLGRSIVCLYTNAPYVNCQKVEA